MPVYFEVTLCLFVKAGRFNKPSAAIIDPLQQGTLRMYNRTGITAMRIAL